MSSRESYRAEMAIIDRDLRFMRLFIPILAGAMVLGLVLGMIKLAFLPPPVDPDSPGLGMRVKVDKATGCEYLVKTGGLFSSDSITSRLNADGKPICR